MASSTASSSALMASGLSSQSFVGLRRASARVDCLGSSSGAGVRGLVAVRKGNGARVRCDALSAPVIISLSTGGLLFLGRFVFLPFQRAQVAKAGLPRQNGVTHFEAGDTRAAEVSSLLKTNDPAGFTLIDVLAWGALGHAVAFFILATASNGYESPF